MKFSFGERIALTYLVMTIGTLIGCVIGYTFIDATLKQISVVVYLSLLYTTVFAIALYYSPSGE